MVGKLEDLWQNKQRLQIDHLDRAGHCELSKKFIAKSKVHLRLAKNAASKK